VKFAFVADSEADRSINDLTQYPVYPWIISDYTSQSLGKSLLAYFMWMSVPICFLVRWCKRWPEPGWSFISFSFSYVSSFH